MLDGEAAMTTFLNLHRGRAGDRARPDHDRQLEVVGHRGGPEVRAGQVGRQLDQPEGRRGGVPASRRALVRRYGAARRRDGVRRAGAGRHRRRARSRSASAPTSCSPSRRASTRPTSSSTRTSSPSPPASRSTTTTPCNFIEATRRIKAALPRREGQRRRQQPLVLVPRQRRRARGDARGVPLSRDPAGLDMGIVNAGQLAVYEEIPTDAARARRGRPPQPPAGRDRAAGRVRRAA